MKPWRFKKRHIAETIARFFMLLSFLIVAASLISILWTVFGARTSSLSWQMISQTLRVVLPWQRGRDPQCNCGFPAAGAWRNRGGINL